MTRFLGEKVAKSKTTRMHYSKMRTIRCSGCLLEGGGGGLPGGSAWGVSAYEGVSL